MSFICKKSWIIYLQNEYKIVQALVCIFFFLILQSLQFKSYGSGRNSLNPAYVTILDPTLSPDDSLCHMINSCEILDFLDSL